ncbi:hypothetical protein [Flavimaricola marinus]|uniref:Cytidine deaminase n=1 Tax=Flavimaricola marinus TaxID=1819565 RepID=A0A238LDV4_9RHOB|nr:hypothetical protein [Flavimaricola marinus]SMY07136.1 Cytidine deaminase [Flavimaricola marinus]
MSRNPFQADPQVPARLACHDAEAVRDAAAPLIEAGVLPRADALDLVDRFGLGGVSDLMCHLLETAKGLSRPPISGFVVGAVGLGAATGDLILGGNMEFPGTSLHHTLHGEGFVAIRAFQRGEGLAELAIGEAHPCAHCRQVLTEFAGADDLILIDPLGHRLSLAELYPWPFDPGYLDQPGAVAGVGHGLQVAGEVPDTVARLLSRTPIHAPYSGVPAALVLEAGGRMVAGGSIESVAFNPTLAPVQTALVALVAEGGAPSDISAAWLAQPEGGAVDHGPPTKSLLAAIAPGAPLTEVRWR